MTITELFKSVHHVEMRTNRLAPASSPGFQLLGIAAGMEDGQNHDTLRFDQKMNHKRKPAENHRPDGLRRALWGNRSGLSAMR